jgi:hypothetical protein
MIKRSDQMSKKTVEKIKKIRQKARRNRKLAKSLQKEFMHNSISIVDEYGVDDSTIFFAFRNIAYPKQSNT